MTQALYRKWRPRKWDEVVGQQHIVQTLRNAVTGERVAHAYLFSGPRGTGKTTLARLLAKAVNCLAEDLAARPCNTCAHCTAVNEGRFLDLIEIDAASQTGVEDVRDLRDKINFSPNQGKYKVYVVDECFRYEDLITLADGSKIPIGKIVEAGLNVEVLSYNEHTHKLEPKPIVRHMRKQPHSPTVRITFDNNRVLVCTINHKFYTPTGQLRAGKLEVGQFVYANYESITQQQLSVIAGAVLGDGHLALTGSKMRARLCITQGIAQKEYLDYKVQLLGNLVETLPIYQNYPGTFSAKGTYRVSTVSRPQIAELHRELYPNGHKRITQVYLEKITPLSLAIWYLDDGSLITSPNPYTRKDGGVSHYPATRSTIGVYGFSLEEAQLIVQWLQEKWGIKGGFSNTAKGPVIWLTLEGTDRLHEIIAPYVPPSMDYKLLQAYRNKFNPPTDDGTPAGLAVSIVRDIERVPPPEFVYNIEVADNHNYFARDILVSNCHMFSTSAFNALLKTLEEPPPHAIFVLATTEMHKIPATVLSRCQRHEFRRVPLDDIVRQLDQIAQAEGIQAEPEALTLIARQATGSLRDGISLLDQMASTGQKISLELTQTVLGTATTQTVLDLLDAILDNRPDAGLEAIHRSLDTGVDARLLARQIVDYLRALLLVKLGNEAQVDLGADTRLQVKRHAGALPAPEILRMTRLFNAAATDLRGGWQPSLSLELALAEAMQNPQAVVMPSATGGEKPPETRSRPEVPPRYSLPSRTDVPPVFAARTVSRPDRGVQDKPPEASSAPSAPPLESAPESKSATGAVSLDKVAKAWRQIRAAIRPQNPALEALLNSCKLLEIKEGTLMLGFASDLLRSKMDTPEQLDATRRVIAEVLGVNLTVRCMVSNAKQSTPPDVKQDGMVAAALKAGGEIVDIQD